MAASSITAFFGGTSAGRSIAANHIIGAEKAEGADTMSRMWSNLTCAVTIKNAAKVLGPVPLIASFAVYLIPFGAWAIRYLQKEGTQKTLKGQVTFLEERKATGFENSYHKYSATAGAKLAAALIKTNEVLCTIPGVHKAAEFVDNNLDKVYLVAIVVEGVAAVILGHYLFAGCMVGSAALTFASQSLFFSERSIQVMNGGFFAVETAAGLILGSIVEKMYNLTMFYGLFKSLYLLFSENKSQTDDEVSGDNEAAAGNGVVSKKIVDITDLSKQLSVPAHTPIPLIEDLEELPDELKHHASTINLSFYNSMRVLVRDVSMPSYRRFCQIIDNDNIDFTEFVRSIMAEQGESIAAETRKNWEWGAYDPARDWQREERPSWEPENRDVRVFRSHVEMPTAPEGITPLNRRVRNDFDTRIASYDFSRCIRLQELINLCRDDDLLHKDSARRDEFSKITTVIDRNERQEGDREILESHMRAGIQNLLDNTVKLNSPNEPVQKILAFTLRKILKEEITEEIGRKLVEWGLKGHECNLRKNDLIYEMYGYLVGIDQSPESSVQLKTFIALDNLRTRIQSEFFVALNGMLNEGAELMMGPVGALIYKLFVTGDHGGNDIHSVTLSKALCKTFKSGEVIEQADRSFQFAAPRLKAMQHASADIIGPGFTMAVRGISKLVKAAKLFFNPNIEEQQADLNMAVTMSPDKMLSWQDHFMWGQYTAKKIVGYFKEECLVNRTISQEELRRFINTWWEENAGPEQDITVRLLAQKGGCRRLNALFDPEHPNHEDLYNYLNLGYTYDKADFLDAPVKEVLLNMAALLNPELYNPLALKAAENPSDQSRYEKKAVDEAIDTFSIFLLGALGILEINPHVEEQERQARVV
ncbi:MAG: hypothetical protein WB791_04955 [Waddliaceae bacterium]